MGTGRGIDGAYANCWNDAATPWSGLIAGRMTEKWDARVLFAMGVLLWLFKPFFDISINFFHRLPWNWENTDLHFATDLLIPQCWILADASDNVNEARIKQASPEGGGGMWLLQKSLSHQRGRWGVVRVLSLNESRHCPASAWKRFCRRALTSTA